MGYEALPTAGLSLTRVLRQALQVAVILSDRRNRISPGPGSPTRTLVPVETVPARAGGRPPRSIAR
jgi:hypothetical protein